MTELVCSLTGRQERGLRVGGAMCEPLPFGGLRFSTGGVCVYRGDQLGIAAEQHRHGREPTEEELAEEVPYATAVEIETFREADDPVYIVTPDGEVGDATVNFGEVEDYQVRISDQFADLAGRVGARLDGRTRLGKPCPAPRFETHGWTGKQSEKLIRLGLVPYLDMQAVFISDQVGISKPNPKLYSAALRAIDPPWL